MRKIMVDGELLEKWHMKPLEVNEGDCVRFTYKPPKSQKLCEKTGTVDLPGRKETVAFIDVDDAGQWVLRHGAVEIRHDGRDDRYHGTLIDFEKIPEVGMKVITDNDIVGEVTEVHLDRDTVRIQRTFNETNILRDFDQIREVQ